MMKRGPEVDHASPPLPQRPMGARKKEKRDKRKGISSKGKRNRRSQTREAEELPREVTPPPPETGTIDMDLVEDLHWVGLAALTLDTPLPIIQPMKTLWSEQVEIEEENELLTSLTREDVFNKDSAEMIPIVHNTPSPELQRQPKPMKSRVRAMQSWPLPAATDKRIKRARVVEPPVYRDSPLKFFSLDSGPFGPTTGVRANKISVDSLRCSDDWISIEMVKFGPSVRPNIKFLGKRELILEQDSSTLVRLVERRPVVGVAVGDQKEPVSLAIFRHKVTGRSWCRCMSRTSDHEVCLFEPGSPPPPRDASTGPRPYSLAWLRERRSPLSPDQPFGGFGGKAGFVRTQPWGQHMS